MGQKLLITIGFPFHGEHLRFLFIHQNIGIDLIVSSPRVTVRGKVNIDINISNTRITGQ